MKDAGTPAPPTDVRDLAGTPLVPQVYTWSFAATGFLALALAAGPFVNSRPTGAPPRGDAWYGIVGFALAGVACLWWEARRRRDPVTLCPWKGQVAVYTGGRLATVERLSSLTVWEWSTRALARLAVALVIIGLVGYGQLTIPGPSRQKVSALLVGLPLLALCAAAAWKYFTCARLLVPISDDDTRTVLVKRALFEGAWPPR